MAAPAATEQEEEQVIEEVLEAPREWYPSARVQEDERVVLVYRPTFKEENVEFDRMKIQAKEKRILVGKFIMSKESDLYDAVQERNFEKCFF